MYLRPWTNGYHELSNAPKICEVLVPYFPLSRHSVSKNVLNKNSFEAGLYKKHTGSFIAHFMTKNNAKFILLEKLHTSIKKVGAKRLFRSEIY